MNISCHKNYTGYYVNVDGINDDYEISKLINISYEDYIESLIVYGAVKIDSGYYFSDDEDCEKFINEGLLNLYVNGINTDKLKFNCYCENYFYYIKLNGIFLNERIPQELNNISSNLYKKTFIDNKANYSNTINGYFFHRVGDCINCINTILLLQNKKEELDKQEIQEIQGKTRKITIIN